MNAESNLVLPDTQTKRERPVAPAPVDPNATPMQMLAIMTQRGVSMADLKELVALAKDWEAGQARKAFIKALAAFKANPPRVIKDKVNPQYKSKYASLGNLVNTVNVGLGEHGFSANWTLHQADKIKVACVLSHVQGHSERVELESVPDNSGSKNPLQQIKSTITYLEGATFQAITGIVATDEGDDDGNGSGPKPRPLEPEGYAQWSADMEALAEEGLEKLQNSWKASKDEFRRYVVKNDEQWWSDIKRKAAKVKVQP